jgi:cytochrome d ubiquinol oxidase subunit I
MLLASGTDGELPGRRPVGLRWLRGDRSPIVMAALRTGVYLAAILIPLQIFVGDLHGLNTLEHQPQKVAAMEGNWQTGRACRCCCSPGPTRRRARTISRSPFPTAPA